MFVCCECCVLSGRGLCDGLITRPEQSYRLWRVVVCDQETSTMRRSKPATELWKIQPQGCNARKTNNKQLLFTTLNCNTCLRVQSTEQKHKYIIVPYITHESFRTFIPADGPN